jgi:hypothetical protein
MLPGYPGNTTRAAQPGGIIQVVHSVLAVCFKGTSPQTIRPGDGVSTYLALTFGTLLSSQGTEASFETVSPVPPGFPFGFSSLSDLFRPDSRWRDSRYSRSGLSAFALSDFSRSFPPDFPPHPGTHWTHKCPRHSSKAETTTYWRPVPEANPPPGPSPRCCVARRARAVSVAYRQWSKPVGHDVRLL